MMPKIDLWKGLLPALLPLYRLSTGLESDKGILHLLEIEKARRTETYVATENETPIGLCSLFMDRTGAIIDLEPPQIIDLAVLPSHQRQGIARGLVDRVCEEVRQAGHPFVWLSTDGGSQRLLATYLKLGFQLASVTPDWGGLGESRAWFRRDLRG